MTFIIGGNNNTPGSTPQKPTTPNLQNFGVSIGRGGILMPKVRHRYRVLFDGNFGTGQGIHLTQQNMSCDTPTISFENRAEYWIPVKMCFRDDVPSTAKTELLAQIYKQQTANKNNQIEIFECRIEIMDDTSTHVLTRWTLENCQIHTLNNGSLSYSTSDVCTWEMTVSYTNAVCQ